LIHLALELKPEIEVPKGHKGLAKEHKVYSPAFPARAVSSTPTRNVSCHETAMKAKTARDVWLVPHKAVAEVSKIGNL
jgi:hypothetical protein